jgi:hypothetical protein
MRVLRGSSDLNPHEMVIYRYWMVMMSLLKEGIPYEVLDNATEDEISLIMGISAAIKQKENEDMERNAAKAY